MGLCPERTVTGRSSLKNRFNIQSYHVSFKDTAALGEACVGATHRGFESALMANGRELDTSLCDIPPLSSNLPHHPFSEENAVCLYHPAEGKDGEADRWGRKESAPLPAASLKSSYIYKNASRPKIPKLPTHTHTYTRAHPTLCCHESPIDQMRMNAQLSLKGVSEVEIITSLTAFAVCLQEHPRKKMCQHRLTWLDNIAKHNIFSTVKSQTNGSMKLNYENYLVI